MKQVGIIRFIVDYLPMKGDGGDGTAARTLFVTSWDAGSFQHDRFIAQFNSHSNLILSLRKLRHTEVVRQRSKVTAMQSNRMGFCLGLLVSLTSFFPIL